MRQHFSRVKDGVLVAVQRRDAGRAEHEISFMQFAFILTLILILILKSILILIFLTGDFALRATSLFSWTEAGHGPAPSLRLQKETVRVAISMKAIIFLKKKTVDQETDRWNFFNGNSRNNGLYVFSSNTEKGVSYGVANRD